MADIDSGGNSATIVRIPAHAKPPSAHGPKAPWHQRLGRATLRRAQAGLVVLGVIGVLAFGLTKATAGSDPPLAEHAFRQATIEAEYEPYGYVAHAMGSVGDQAYTNTPEAFAASYEKGFRIFEVDLVLLADGNVLAAHPGLEHDYGLDKPFTEATLDEIRPYAPHGRDLGLSVLTGAGLIDLMAHHPDVLVVTDTKDDHVEILEALVREAERRGDGIADRLVPHVGSPSEFEEMQSVHRFPSSMLALYRTQAAGQLDDDEVIDFIRAHEIPAVMMWSRPRLDTLSLAENTAEGRRITDEFVDRIRAAGAVVYVHSVRDPADIEFYRSLQIGVYSDGVFLEDRDE